MVLLVLVVGILLLVPLVGALAPLRLHLLRPAPCLGLLVLHLGPLAHVPDDLPVRHPYLDLRLL